MSVARSLTGGETAACRTMFGTTIDYRKVVIHKGKCIFFQPSDTAMTPNGEIYFPDPVYKPDYSPSVGDASWLIHELTHVWQHQRGMWVRTRAVLNRTYDYGQLDRKKPFTSYSLEQQASIVADCYLIEHAYKPGKGSGSLADYRAVISFLPRPGR